MELLQIEYNRTWQTLIAASEEMQQVLAQPTPGDETMASARTTLEQAAAAYREARNELALYMLECGVQGSSSEFAEQFTTALARSHAA